MVTPTSQVGVVLDIEKFTGLMFAVHDESAKTAKIMCLQIWPHAHETTSRFIRSSRYFKVNSDAKLPDLLGPLWNGNMRSHHWHSERVVMVPRHPLARSLFPNSCIPAVLVHMVPMNHYLNVECFRSPLANLLVSTRVV